MPAPGERVPRGMKSPVTDPKAVIKRLLGYLFKYYKLHLILVFTCIIISVVANLQGTMFIQVLIDDYIVQLIKSEHPDFSMLRNKIISVAVFYAVGVIATFTYSRIMVYVTQGFMMHLRNDMFTHMERLPIRYFDSHQTGDIM